MLTTYEIQTQQIHKVSITAFHNGQTLSLRPEITKWYYIHKPQVHSVP